ncbi:MAG: 3,4-dihydroxy-2-butanone-4-phosphate synthase [Candidatus Poseidoniaceae archaeon]|jgi:3,4-dihydroxy 2-butanone 4-phosphate synthase|nr:3,4-dihydroxy-2-butanone-4-phosphate synthase [Candidatus Poseidoniaceae archaeon]MDP7202868.1 3,4-dihydroxy-2-butanone-4-phosphate synthase [Candidatus Poseidoniaceae archaeon]|tara:strand:+ start:255 stop:947 length:693 start_codon:yes stop_codon:yes gene_type:complete
MSALQAAIEAFSKGLPICVFDAEWREGETDLLFPARSATPAAIRQLRKDCGGLLFLAIGHEVGELFKLPFLQDLHTEQALVTKYPVLGELVTNDLQYDARSAFTLSLNHRDTFTGITDSDRSLTTRKFAELYDQCRGNEDAVQRLGNEFRTPGHIPVCRETEGGLKVRQGHTELAVTMARLAALEPVVIGAEMLQPDGDGALSVEAAQEWAELRGIPFISGSDILSEVKQ